MDDAQAHLLAKEMLLDVLCHSSDGFEGVITFVQHLDLIKANNKGFAHELAIDSDGLSMG